MVAVSGVMIMSRFNSVPINVGSTSFIELVNPIRCHLWRYSLTDSKWVFLILVNIILLVLGCVLEGTAILLIVVPVFIPTAQALSIDMVHFGVMVVVNIMLGLVTPPYGLLLFVMTSITGVPLRDLVRDVLPFLAAMIAALAVITFVPETVLWLPRLLGYED